MAMQNDLYVEILEQPDPWRHRFRYNSERQSHGSIQGITSTKKKETYPKIRIVGLKTSALVLVSCVTKNEPYRTHPHQLVVKNETTDHGVFIAPIPEQSNEIEFKHMSVQCVKKKDIKSSLEDRKLIKVDPFKQGFDHMDSFANYELHVVRLCFQVFLVDEFTGRCNKALKPVVSAPIFDKQIAENLMICSLSPNVGSMKGGHLTIIGRREIKDDVKVRFFEERGGRVVWEDDVQILPRMRTMSSVIVTVSTPPYTIPTTSDSVSVKVQLIRPLFGVTGKPVTFTLRKDPEEPIINCFPKRTRQELTSDSINSEFSQNNLEIAPPNDKTTTTSHRGVSDEVSWNIPPVKMSQILYPKMAAGGSLIHPTAKKPKFSEGATAGTSNFHPGMFNNISERVISLGNQNWRMNNEVRGDNGGWNDGSLQLGPSLAPIGVDAKEEEIQPPINIDVQVPDPLIHGNNKLLDSSDLSKYLLSITGSLSEIKI